jgi:hypothetical protein
MSGELIELVYVQIFLADGGVRAWSYLKAEALPTGESDWRDLFTRPAMKSPTPRAKVMVHFIGDDATIPDWTRLKLIDEANAAGYGVVRFESGEPLLDPEEAFGLLLAPFT